MTFKFGLKVTSAMALASLGMLTEAALAQGPALEEIVVTARRREESLMEVPVSVSALTADSIQNRGIKSIQELSEFTPGMFSQVGGNGRVDRSTRRLTFRGLSVAQGATFIDGVPYSGNANPDVTDVERVEVLKGPQSVYFGRATYSGAVNYVMKRPSDEFRGTVSTDIYSYGGFDTSLSLEGPIIEDRLNARVRGKKFSFGGQYLNGGHNVERDRMGEQSTQSVSVAADFTPTDSLTISTFYSFTDDDDGAPYAAAIQVPGPQGLPPNLTCEMGGTGGAWWCGPLPRVDAFDPRDISVYNIVNDFTHTEIIDNIRGYPYPFDAHWKQNFGIKRHTHNAFVKLDYALPNEWEVSSIVSYNWTKYQALIDQHYVDGSHLPNPFYPATPAALAAACAAPSGTAANQPCFTLPFAQLTLLNQSYNTDMSAEVRVSTPQDWRLRATLGANQYRSYNPGGTNMGFQQAGRLTQPSNKSGTTTPAIFGGLYYDITPELTVSAEARYQWDKIRQQQKFPTVSARFRGTFKSFSPRLTVDYNIDDDSMVFATFSRGFRPGGFNTTLSGLTPFILNQVSILGSNPTYLQEKLDNFEIGHKARWMDGRLRTTVTAYYMKWLDGQNTNTLFITRDDGSTGSVSVTQNIGRVNMKGIEVEADFAATENLTVSATLDINDNKVVGYIYTPDGLKINNSTNVQGKRLMQAPSNAWTLSPQYNGELTGEWNWFARLDYRHRGKIFVDQHNIAWLEARDLFNFRAGVSKEGFRLDFYINNLFDDKKLIEGIRMNDPLFGPGVGVACPPCYSAAAPVNVRGGSILNILRVGLPVKRTFGVTASYEF